MALTGQSEKYPFKIIKQLISDKAFIINGAFTFIQNFKKLLLDLS